MMSALEERPKGRKPSLRTLTAEQRERFLELVRGGKSRPAAAQEVGSTGSRFRALCREGARTYDPDFAAAYALALTQCHDGIVDDLREEYLHMAMDRDNAHQSRALHNNLLFYDGEYRHAHQQKIAVGAKATPDGEIQILLAFSGSDAD